MKQLLIANHVDKGAFAAAAFFGTFVVPPTDAVADEGGVSFWVPGMFGSLAAVPQQQPGRALATVYYHTSVFAGGDVALAREFTIRRIPANVTASLNANLNATGDLAFVVPSYAFATPVLGGQHVKAYFEFDSHDRPSGWNTWLTFAVSPPAPPAPTPPLSRSPMIYQ